MRSAHNTALNPFSLMMEPELVLQTMERSQQLRGLRRHKLRPLDKPLIPYTKEAVAARAAFDAAIDAGITLFDTAENYPTPTGPETQGRSEEVLGRWIAARV